MTLFLTKNQLYLKLADTIKNNDLIASDTLDGIFLEDIDKIVTDTNLVLDVSCPITYFGKNHPVSYQELKSLLSPR